MAHRTLFRTITSVVFLAVIGFALVVILATFRETGPGSLSATPGYNPVITQLFIPDLDQTQTVAAIITFKAIDEATYLATTRTPVTPIYLPTGIYEDQRVKISGSLLFIDAQNAWGGIIDEYPFTLYAGALQSDPDQGLVYLVTHIPGVKGFERFLTPSKHGALRVVSQQNNRLTLIATDETVFYFDVPARQYVASLTEVVPSVTPYPPGFPTPTGIPYPPPAPPDFPYPFTTTQDTPVP
jgi:hypothetical protein